MNRLVYKYYILRSQLRRRERVLFMSPAEVKFVQIMKGKVLTIPFVTHARTTFPLTIVLSLGRALRKEDFKREVREGRYFLDFGNDIKRGIEIQGLEFHRDYIKEETRHEFLQSRGWSILYIEARDLWRKPQAVKARVLAFINK